MAASRWAVPVLVVALASLVGTAAAWSTSTGLELLGQEDSHTSRAIPGGLELVLAGLDRLPAGNEASRAANDTQKPPSKKRTKLTVKSIGSGSGWLSINAIPWADVYWNKKHLGVTPLERIKMPVGKHTLVLINNCVGENKTVEVQILKGQLTKKVVDLLK